MTRSTGISAVALIAALGGFGSPGRAATDAAADTTAVAEPGKAGQLVEIIVTAQKRSENLQKAPVAVTALSADDLRRGDIRSSADLGKEVPGLIMASTGANPLVFMRGVGGAAAAPYSDPAFAFFVDGVNYSRPQGATGAFYDISQVEVLKGPQGTLYGRNTASGAIVVRTADPVFKYEGEIGAGIGNYADFSSEGMVNVPVTDQLAIRAALKTDRHDGYLTLGYNDARDAAGRVKILYQANDDISIKLTGSYFNKAGKGPGDVPLNIQTGTYFNPSNPWEQFRSAYIYPDLYTAVPSDGRENTSVYLAQLDLDWNLGFADLTVTPAFVENDHTGLQYDGGFYQKLYQHSDQYSLEARLSSKRESRLKWLAALYYLKENQAFVETQQVGVNDLPSPPFPSPNYLFQNISDPNVATRSAAVYGEATYPILDWLRATAGARYTADLKSQEVTTFNSFRAADSLSNLFALPGDITGGSKIWHFFNWKLSLDADITPSSLVYVKASTGTRPGGFDTERYTGPFTPEKLTAYAIGSKNRFFGNTLRVNAEAFYYYYKNLQENAFGFGNPPGFGPTPPDSVIAFETINVPASHIAGIDLSTDYLLTPDDHFTINVSYTHGRYDNFTVPAFPPVGQVYADYSGTVKDHSPLWSGNLSYEHIFELADDAEIVAGIHSVFSSSLRMTFQRVPPGALQPAYTITDAQIGYTPPNGNWSVDLHVDNIENNGVLTDALASPGAGRAAGYWASPLPPRTYGVSFRATF